VHREVIPVNAPKAKGPSGDVSEVLDELLFGNEFNSPEPIDRNRFAFAESDLTVDVSK
jgi:hypothetical protein